MSEADCQVLTPPEVAAQLGVHRDVVYGWLREGQLPAVKLGGVPTGHYRINAADLQAALDAWRVPQESS